MFCNRACRNLTVATNRTDWRVINSVPQSNELNWIHIDPVLGGGTGAIAAVCTVCALRNVCKDVRVYCNKQWAGVTAPPHYTNLFRFSSDEGRGVETRHKLPGLGSPVGDPGPGLCCVCFYLSRCVIIRRVHKLTLSDPVQVTLKLKVSLSDLVSRFLSGPTLLGGGGKFFFSTWARPRCWRPYFLSLGL